MLKAREIEEVIDETKEETGGGLQQQAGGKLSETGQGLGMGEHTVMSRDGGDNNLSCLFCTFW